MSEKVIIDLTDNFAHEGEAIEFCTEYKPTENLLPYPNAELSNVSVRLTATFTKPNVLLQGTLSCYIRGFCDRCLAEISRQTDLSFNQIFYKDVADDEDGYVYSGSKLDATKAICDEIVLSLPIAFLCKEDCKGLCPKCGTNLNDGQCDCDVSRENAFAALKNLKF